jgi:hypothetical protein
MEMLPEDVAPLALLQAASVTDLHFDYEVQLLIEVVEKRIGPAEPAAGRPASLSWVRPALLSAAGVVAVLVVIGLAVDSANQAVSPVVPPVAGGGYAPQESAPPSVGMTPDLSPGGAGAAPVPPSDPVYSATPQAPSGQPVYDVSVNLPPQSAEPDALFSYEPDVAADASAAALLLLGTFLSLAAAAETEAYQFGDAERAAFIYQGAALDNLRNSIAQLQAQGLTVQPNAHVDRSYIHDVRPVQPGRIEVDTCEVWSNTYYQNMVPVRSEGPVVVPQTITIQDYQSQSFIIAVQLYEAPAFCRQ